MFSRSRLCELDISILKERAYIFMYCFAKRREFHVSISVNAAYAFTYVYKRQMQNMCFPSR